MSHWSSASFMVLLCTVGTSVCSLPARSSSPRMAMMPPARCTSSMWYLLVLGATLHSCGTTSRHAVDVGHGEVDLGLLRNRQQVQDGVGRAAHGDVQRNRVLEGLEADGARQHGFVVLLVVALAQLHDQATGALEQLLAVGVRGHHRAVARQGQAQRFGQAVHGVGGEHARAGTAGRAGGALHFGHIVVATPCRRRPSPWRRSGRAS